MFIPTPLTAALPVLCLGWTGLAHPIGVPAPRLERSAVWIMTQDGADKPQLSLEELLREARAKREAVLAAMRTKVAGFLSDLESASARVKPEQAMDLRKQLVKMGPEVAPLLVPALHPSETSSRGDRFRAAEVTKVLRSLRSPAITSALIDAAAKGSPDGRLNALRVLEVDPNPERALPGVRVLYEAASGKFRTAALLALAHLGSPDTGALIANGLADPDEKRVDALLTGLALLDRSEVADQVARFLASPRAAAHVTPLLEYYRVRIELLNEEHHLVALVRLAASPTTDRDRATRILKTLASLDVRVKGDAKKALSSLQESTLSDLREATLILLARSRDKSARRALLRDYDDRVRVSRASPSAYTDRGDIYYRIGEYQNAIKDFKEAIGLQRGQNGDSEPHLGIARSYARLKRYGDAEDYLATATVSMTTLRDLAKDPAFALMLETKYRRAFHLRE